MRQPVRMIVRPDAFFNQIQWSKNHWFFLAAFLTIAMVENHIGIRQNTHRVLAEMVAQNFNWSFGFALGVLTAVRLVAVLVVATAGAWGLWIIGNMFGRSSSPRVLFRRLSVVATILLAGYTLRHLSGTGAEWAGLALTVWGAFLGYFALREQFQLNRWEALIFASFALVASATSWQLTQEFVDKAVREQVAQHHVEMQKRLR